MTLCPEFFLQYKYASLRGVYKPDPKEFFSYVKSKGSNQLVKMVKIDQNHRGGGMTGARSFDSNQIVISSNTDCVSELHMSQFPQDGNFGQNVSVFFEKSRALL